MKETPSFPVDDWLKNERWKIHGALSSQFLSLDVLNTKPDITKLEDRELVHAYITTQKTLSGLIERQQERIIDPNSAEQRQEAAQKRDPRITEGFKYLGQFHAELEKRKERFKEQGIPFPPNMEDREL